MLKSFMIIKNNRDNLILSLDRRISILEEVLHSKEISGSEFPTLGIISILITIFILIVSGLIINDLREEDKNRKRFVIDSHRFAGLKFNDNFEF